MQFSLRFPISLKSLKNYTETSSKFFFGYVILSLHFLYSNFLENRSIISSKIFRKFLRKFSHISSKCFPNCFENFPLKMFLIFLLFTLLQNFFTIFQILFKIFSVLQNFNKIQNNFPSLLRSFLTVFSFQKVLRINSKLLDNFYKAFKKI